MAIPNIYVISDQTAALGQLCFGAKKLSGKVTAVLFGDETVAKATACGADVIHYCPVDDHAPEDYAKAIAALVKSVPSALVILGNTVRGRCLAGKLGVYLDTAVLTNVSELFPDGDKLRCTRTVFGGAAVSCEVFSTTYGVLTAGNGVFGEIDAALPATADVSPLPGKALDTLKCLSRAEKKEGSTNLATAKRIVDVGRGLAAEEDLDLMRKLASVLDAEVGCSRPVAENNRWMPKANYMGVTGVVVKPDLCFSIGVSGQVQHIAGINKSKVIVAVNKDKNAPIFKNADFGVAGDLYKIIPALIEKLS